MKLLIFKNDEYFKVRLFTSLLALLLTIFICLEILSGTSSINSIVKNEIIFPENSEETTISIYSSAKLSGLSLEQILKLRSETIKESSRFLKAEYEPSEIVFSRIKNNEAWYGKDAFYKDGPSIHAGEGISVVSSGILNPFILLVPEFWGLTHWGNGNVKWKDDVTVPEKIYSAAPKILTINALTKEIKVVFDISSHITELNLYTRAPLNSSHVDFGVSAYNARDLGFRFMKFSKEQSLKVNTVKGDVAEYITDHFRFSKSLCGVGCNHYTNQHPRFDSFAVESLPATATFYLWKDKPENNIPDIKFIIELL